MRAQHVGWRPGLRGDAPVAGRRVVHGVVEARGRELAALETLRQGNPAARALPLLQALATQHATNLVLDYLPDTRLQVDLMPLGTSTMQASAS